MGRFTLRDEGKTIAVGKITKYKPAKFVAAELEAKEAEKNTEEVKAVDPLGQKDDYLSPNQTEYPSSTASSKAKEKDLIYDFETGELKSKDELNHVNAIEEEDEDYYDEEDEDQNEEDD